jgi:hypothetical protein
MLWCVFDMCVAEYCSDRVRKRNGYHWREEEREREMETGGGQKRQSGGGQQNRGKHVNPNGVLHGPMLQEGDDRRMLAASRIFSPSELQNGAINGETVLWTHCTYRQSPPGCRRRACRGLSLSRSSIVFCLQMISENSYNMFVGRV